MADFKYAVVGGGIVGLAVAARLSAAGPTVLFERRPRLLQETSSHNSGVVHAGIYYPPGSLKTALCLRGASAIWRMAAAGLVDARQCGKWIVATQPGQNEELAKFEEAMRSRGVPSRWVSKEEALEAEPHVVATRILCSPRTGIVDVHSLADAFLARITASDGSLVALGSDLTGVAKTPQGLRLAFADGATVEAQHLVNCAGLHASHVARLCFGSCPEDYRQHFVRGLYVTVPQRLTQRLVYPCPLPGLRGLGAHSVIDIGGTLRFGPDATAVSTADAADLSYAVEAGSPAVRATLDDIHLSLAEFLPAVRRCDMRPDFVGFRPKLSPTEFRDFVVERGDRFGHSSVVTCAGIESPGLTASPAIAERVASLLGIEDSFSWVPPA